ncbi:hypothetical protein EYF80_044784 [Liparis tanakae]|uniref:Uncharacterized protein n=1 Tax=Liparis tanakae TaxID=230148 RepID=A0A4Z2FXF3_9TELE|nr:hypothetical protein EYF80_044784 [Liparis tanakae]
MIGNALHIKCSPVKLYAKHFLNPISSVGWGSSGGYCVTEAADFSSEVFLCVSAGVPTAEVSRSHLNREEMPLRSF